MMPRVDLVQYVRDAASTIHSALNARRQDNYFISPDLEALLVEVFLTEYAANEARSYVPIRPGTVGAEVQKFRGQDRTGQAKWMSTGGDDVPRVDVSRAESSIKYDSLCDAFGYNLDELEAAALSRQPLDRDRAMAAREVAETDFDDALCFGVTELNTTGLLNNANVELVSVTTGDWPTATPAEILYDFGHDLWGKIMIDTKGRRQANRACFPTDLWVLLNSTPYGSDNNSRTILQVLRENYPAVEFRHWARLDTADAGRTGPRVLTYQYAADVASAWLASEFSFDAPEKKGFSFEILGRLRGTPGAAVIRPLCMKYADNVD